MMKKPMAKKAMPAKKGAAKMAMPAMPMMKKGGMAKKYQMGGASGPPRKKESPYDTRLSGTILPKGGSIEGRTSSSFGPGYVKFSKPAERPAPQKPSMPKMDRKNSPLKDGTYRKGGKAMMRKGGKSC